MAERTQIETPGATPAQSPRVAAPIARHPGAAGALALQRAVGNRAATQVLQRWAAHPDKDKKGVLMPDEVAADFTRFTPPLSK
jgi:hypothetical protein